MADPTPTAKERLKALIAREEGDRVGALLALEAAAEALDPVELGTGVPRERIRALRKEIANG